MDSKEKTDSNSAGDFQSRSVSLVDSPSNPSEGSDASSSEDEEPAEEYKPSCWSDYQNWCNVISRDRIPTWPPQKRKRGCTLLGGDAVDHEGGTEWRWLYQGIVQLTPVPSTSTQLSPDGCMLIGMDDAAGRQHRTGSRPASPPSTPGSITYIPIPILESLPHVHRGARQPSAAPSAPPAAHKASQQTGRQSLVRRTSAPERAASLDEPDAALNDGHAAPQAEPGDSPQTATGPAIRPQHVDRPPASK